MNSIELYKKEGQIEIKYFSKNGKNFSVDDIGMNLLNEFNGKLNKFIFHGNGQVYQLIVNDDYNKLYFKILKNNKTIFVSKISKNIGILELREEIKKQMNLLGFKNKGNNKTSNIKLNDNGKKINKTNGFIQPTFFYDKGTKMFGFNPNKDDLLKENISDIKKYNIHNVINEISFFEKLKNSIKNIDGKITFKIKNSTINKEKILSSNDFEINNFQDLSKVNFSQLLPIVKYENSKKEKLFVRELDYEIETNFIFGNKYYQDIFSIKFDKRTASLLLKDEILNKIIKKINCKDEFISIIKAKKSLINLIANTSSTFDSLNFNDCMNQNEKYLFSTKENLLNFENFRFIKLLNFYNNKSINLNDNNLLNPEIEELRNINNILYENYIRFSQKRNELLNIAYNHLIK